MANTRPKKSLGDAFSKYLNVRISDNHFIFLSEVSNLLGCTPSDYVRMLINSSMVSYAQKVGGDLNENKERNLYD